MGELSIKKLGVNNCLQLMIDELNLKPIGSNFHPSPNFHLRSELAGFPPINPSNPAVLPTICPKMMALPI
jgi:hypothetical protein